MQCNTQGERISATMYDNELFQKPSPPYAGQSTYFCPLNVWPPMQKRTKYRQQSMTTSFSQKYSAPYVGQSTYFFIKWMAPNAKGEKISAAKYDNGLFPKPFIVICWSIDIFLSIECMTCNVKGRNIVLLRLTSIVYHETSYMRRTLVGNKIVDHSDEVVASPVGAAPTIYSFST